MTDDQKKAFNRIQFYEGWTREDWFVAGWNASTKSDKQEAGQISKMIECLRERAESDELAASEIDPIHYTPDEPESIAAGLEFIASERRECADMLEHLSAVVADQGHRIASYMAELEARAHPIASADANHEFEWPKLPRLPDPMMYSPQNGLSMFSGHQMQGYANAYGEAVRIAANRASEEGGSSADK